MASGMQYGELWEPPWTSPFALGGGFDDALVSEVCGSAVKRMVQSVYFFLGAVLASPLAFLGSAGVLAPFLAGAATFLAGAAVLATGFLGSPPGFIGMLACLLWNLGCLGNLGCGEMGQRKKHS